MKNIARVSAIGFLLSGCANGGAFVSAGTIEYKKLFDGLHCEIASAYSVASEHEKEKKIRLFDDWGATISVILEGNFNRTAGVDADIDKYGLARSNFFTANLKTNRKVEDAGTVTLGTDEEPLKDIVCPVDGGRGYDMSRLGLHSWYKNVIRRMTNKSDDYLLRSLEFKRKVTFTFIDGTVRFDLLEPFVIGPYAATYNDNVAEITISMKNLQPPSGFDTVNLSPETLEVLADIFKGRQMRSKPGSSAGVGSRAAEDQRVLDRIDKERSQDNLELLQKLKLLDR